jgi:hypothetical protein
MITSGIARRIASEWHSGQGSALYSFASTGSITEDLHREIEREIPNDPSPELIALATYVEECGYRGPVDDWSSKWSDALVEPDDYL